MNNRTPETIQDPNSDQASSAMTTSRSTASTPSTPTEKLSFSVDSLLAKDDDGNRRTPTGRSPECSSKRTTDVDSVDITSELSEDRSTPDSLEQSELSTTSRMSESMVAMLRQRAEFFKQTQIPNNPLIYPWLMSTGGALSNPASFLNPSAFPNPGKLLSIC